MLESTTAVCSSAFSQMDAFETVRVRIDSPTTEKSIIEPMSDLSSSLPGACDREIEACDREIESCDRAHVVWPCT